MFRRSCPAPAPLPSPEVSISALLSKAMNELKIKSNSSALVGLARYVIAQGPRVGRVSMGSFCLRLARESLFACGAHVGLCFVPPALVLSRQPEQCNARMLPTLGRGAGRWIDTLCDFHSASVNPNDITLPTTVYDAAAQSFPKDCVNVRLDLITLAYNDTKKLEKIRPQPDVAEFIKPADVKVLSGRADEVKLIEKHMRNIREVDELMLRKHVPALAASAYVRDLGHQVLRLALGKGSSGVFATKVKGGAMTEARLDMVTHEWRLFVKDNAKLPCGLGAEWDAQEEKVGDDLKDDTVLLVGDEATLSAEVLEIMTKGFTVGKQVILQKRVTGTCVDSSGKEIRRDVQVGTVGVIKDWRLAPMCSCLQGSSFPHPLIPSPFPQSCSITLAHPSPPHHSP